MPKYTKKQIDEIGTQIEEAERRALRQRRRVERMIINGEPPGSARTLLEQLETGLELMRAHHRMMQRLIGDLPVPPGEDYDLRDLSKRLGVSAEELTDAMSEAGPDLDAVTALLARRAS